MSPKLNGIPLSAAYPRAAVTPESGTGTTRSASTGASRARRRPICSRLACTQRPKIRLSGRAKYTCSKMQLACRMPVAYSTELTPSRVTITTSPGRTSRSYLARSRSKAQVSEAKTTVSGPRGIGKAAKGEGQKAIGIAGGEDAVARHHDDRESARNLAQRV